LELTLFILLEVIIIVKEWCFYLQFFNRGIIQKVLIFFNFGVLMRRFLIKCDINLDRSLWGNLRLDLISIK
jgi:hypothetical protein